MKTLFETIFTIVFAIIFITFLPTIIGIVALGAIVWFIFSMLAGSSDSSSGYSSQSTVSEKRDTYDNQVKTNETKRDSGTSNSSTCYSGNRNSSYRRSYDDYEDSYYDDRYDPDMPPEGGDGFRGTGAPFL